MDRGTSALTPSDRAARTAAKYVGATAENYDGKRDNTAKRRGERRVLESLLSGFPQGTEILDCPVGTGWLLPFYHARGFVVSGVDISQDMLTKARGRGVFQNVRLLHGSIFNLPFSDRSFDVAVAIRIMNLIDADDVHAALAELQRVSRNRIIFNLRVWHEQSRYRHPQRLDTVERALRPGWRIAESIEIHEPDFRMFVLCAG